MSQTSHCTLYRITLISLLFQCRNSQNALSVVPVAFTIHSQMIHAYKYGFGDLDLFDRTPNIHPMCSSTQVLFSALIAYEEYLKKKYENSRLERAAHSMKCIVHSVQYGKWNLSLMYCVLRWVASYFMMNSNDYTYWIIMNDNTKLS